MDIVEEHLKGIEVVRILDYGSGTGFAAEQAAAHLGRKYKLDVTCYDPSPEMLAVCRARMERAGVKATYTTENPRNSTFDLLLTNSVLHHLPNLDDFCESAERLLGGKGLWVAGHEPNRAYYLNEECIQLATKAAYARRRQLLLSPSRLLKAIKRRLGFTQTLAEHTASRAYELGYFARRPSGIVVARLVDFGVPHNRAEAEKGRGLDYAHIQALLPKSTRTLFEETYNYLGPFYSPSLERRFSSEISYLRTQFPDSGASQCVVFYVRR